MSNYGDYNITKLSSDNPQQLPPTQSDTSIKSDRETIKQAVADPINTLNKQKQESSSLSNHVVKKLDVGSQLDLLKIQINALDAKIKQLETSNVSPSEIEKFKNLKSKLEIKKSDLEDLDAKLKKVEEAENKIQTEEKAIESAKSTLKDELREETIGKTQDEQIAEEASLVASHERNAKLEEREARIFEGEAQSTDEAKAIIQDDVAIRSLEKKASEIVNKLHALSGNQINKIKIDKEDKEGINQLHEGINSGDYFYLDEVDRNIVASPKMREEFEGKIDLVFPDGTKINLADYKIKIMSDEEFEEFKTALGTYIETKWGLTPKVSEEIPQTQQISASHTAGTTTEVKGYEKEDKKVEKDEKEKKVSSHSPSVEGLFGAKAEAKRKFENWKKQYEEKLHEFRERIAADNFDYNLKKYGELVEDVEKQLGIMEIRIEDSKSLEELDVTKDLKEVELRLNSLEKTWIKQGIIVQKKGKLKRFTFEV